MSCDVLCVQVFQYDGSQSCTAPEFVIFFVIGLLLVIFFVALAPLIVSYISVRRPQVRRERGRGGGEGEGREGREEGGRGGRREGREEGEEREREGRQSVSTVSMPSPSLSVSSSMQMC